MPCMFYAFFPKFMEVGILLQSQNASDLAFPPIEICLGKEEGGNWKRVVETRKKDVFFDSKIRLQKVETGRRKVHKFFEIKG